MTEYYRLILIVTKHFVGWAKNLTSSYAMIPQGIST